jgi:hypothetical protein
MKQVIVLSPVIEAILDVKLLPSFDISGTFYKHFRLLLIAQSSIYCDSFNSGKGSFLFNVSILLMVESFQMYDVVDSRGWPSADHTMFLHQLHHF